MLRIVLTILVTLAATQGARAYCPSFPDSASTRYVQNQQALMLCQQAELAAAVEAQARQAEIRASIETQMQLMEQQRRMQETLSQRQF